MDKKKSVSMLAILTVASVELVGWSGAGIAAGFYGSEHWGWPWWLAASAGIFGVVVAFFRLWQVSQKFAE